MPAAGGSPARAGARAAAPLRAPSAPPTAPGAGPNSPGSAAAAALRKARVPAGPRAPSAAGAPASSAAPAAAGPGAAAPAAAPPPLEKPDSGTVIFKVEGPVATITLNRPEHRNAISPEMLEDLRRSLEICARGPARVVILTGAGPAFCAGMDLAALKAAAGQPRSKHEADTRRLVAVFRLLYTLPRPTIAAVNGPAVAGGCGLATLCDFVLAVPDAAFGFPEVRIGFIPALVSVFLVRQLGERRARELLLSARIVRAEEAQRLGLVTEVVPPDSLMRRAREIANTLVTHSPTSLAETKVLFKDLPGVSLDAALDAAARASARMRETPDFKEGLSAFLEKRKPVWRSR